MPPASIAEPTLDLIAASSDSHWGAGDGSDVANYEGDAAVWDAMFDHRPRIQVFARLGDWLDFWRDSYDKVLAYNELRLRALATRLKQEGRHVYYVLGNHDWVNQGQLARDLYTFGFDSNILTIATPYIELAGWRLEHGHRFDAFCNPRSPLYWLGLGSTKIWGALTDLRGQPGPDGPRPTRSARERGPAALEAVRHKAAKWAIKNGVQLCYGHTHQLDAFHDPFRGYSVANTGCCSKQRASWVLLQSDGEAFPRPIQGAF